MIRKLLLASAIFAFTIPAYAGSVSIQVVETGQTTQTKTFSVADADIDKIVSAFQSGANVAVNGTASRAQVLLYWVNTVLAQPTIQAVQAANTTPPAVPAPIVMQ